MTFIEKLKKIRDERYSVWTNAEYEQGFLDAIQRAIEIYRNHTDWIPIIKPPKENGAYMATIVRIADNHKYSEELVYCKSVNEWYWDDEEENIVDDGFVVIAWQPLPKPYEGE